MGNFSVLNEKERKCFQISIKGSLYSLRGYCEGIWIETEVVKWSVGREGSGIEAVDVMVVPDEMMK